MVLLTVDLGYLALVLLLVGLDRVVMIARWALLLWSSEHDVSLKSAAWMFLVSSFVGSVLPAGVGGDAARAYVLSRRTSATAEAVASVAVDRLLGVVAIALLGVAGLLTWSRRARQLEAASLNWLVPLAILVMVAGVAGLWADKIATPLIPRRGRQSTRAVKLVRLGDAIARYRQRPGTLAVVFALSVAVQWLRILQAYLLGVGLEIEVPLAYYLVFMPVGLLALLLPVSIGGFGLPQGVIVWLLRSRGVADEASFALSTLIVLTGLAGNLPGAWLYVRSKVR